MGGKLGSMRSPTPAEIRAGGVAAVAVVAVPKFIWDLANYRQAVMNRDAKNAAGDDNEEVEPTATTTINSCQLALATILEAWDGIQNHCDGADRLTPQVEHGVALFNAEMTAREIGPPKELAEQTDSSGEYVEDEYFLQWTRTIEKAGLRQLRAVLAGEADDAEAEASLQEMGRCLFMLLMALHTACEVERLARARSAYIAAKYLHDKAVKKDKDSVKVADLADDLERKLKLLRELPGVTQDSELRRHSHWVMTDLWKPADQNGIAPELGHYRAVRENAYKADRVAKSRLDFLPHEESNAQFKDLMRQGTVDLAVALSKVEKVCGSRHNFKFWKLIKFLRMAIGTRQQRLLVLISLLMSSALTSITAVLSNLQSTLLITSISAALTHRGEGAARMLHAATRGRPLHSMISRRSKAAVPLFGDVLASIVVLRLVCSFLNDLQQKVSREGSGSIRRDLSERLTWHILSQDMEDAMKQDRKRQSPADMIKRMQSEREWNRSLGAIIELPEEMINRVVNIFTTGALLWGKSPRLMMAMLGVLFVTQQTDEWLKQFRRILIDWLGLVGNERMAQMMAEWGISEALDEFEDMRVNAKEPDVMRDIRISSKAQEMKLLRQRLVPSFMEPVFNMLSSAPRIICCYFGGQLAMGGSISPADLSNFSVQVSRMVKQTKEFKDRTEEIWNMEAASFDAGLAIVDMLERKPRIGLDDGWKPDPIKQTLATEGEDQTNVLPANSIGGDIVFKSVNFKFQGMQNNLLKKIDFNIKAGSFVGICGERGAGKSTLFKLMMRLWDVQSGLITVGGHPVSYYNPVWLRSQIGLAKQDPMIIRSKTLRENIIYGSERTLSKLGDKDAIDARINFVMTQVNIKEHFENKDKFPQGLNTPCFRLSGGETRSIGLCRALLVPRSILLLDEPTEGLDAENEAKVTNNLVHERPAGQTVVAIAHRLSTIRSSDLIIFMDKDGCTAEIGPWDELCAMPDGKFASFVKIQTLNPAPALTPLSSLGSPLAALGGSPLAAAHPDLMASLSQLDLTRELSAQSMRSLGSLEGLGSPQMKVAVQAYKDMSWRRLKRSMQSLSMIRDCTTELSAPLDDVAVAIEKLRDLTSDSDLPQELLNELANACDHILNYECAKVDTAGFGLAVDTSLPEVVRSLSLSIGDLWQDRQNQDEIEDRPNVHVNLRSPTRSRFPGFPRPPNVTRMATVDGALHSTSPTTSKRPFNLTELRGSRRPFSPRAFSVDSSDELDSD